MTNLSLTACRERGTDAAATATQRAKALRAQEMRRIMSWLFGSQHAA
ncbi:MAG: hypothetical protein AAGH74_07370 [Pseudomonadota bacterium]